MSECRERGLEHFFGIPGGGAPLELIEAGRRSGVQFVNMSNESSAGVAAAYYGRLKGSAGLAMAIRGVGAGNLVGGATNAHFERMPLVGLCEMATSSMAGGESVQQCEQEKLFAAVAKYQKVLAPETACRAIKEAFFEAADGRPGGGHPPSSRGPHGGAGGFQPPGESRGRRGLRCGRFREARTDGARQPASRDSGGRGHRAHGDKRAVARAGGSAGRGGAGHARGAGRLPRNAPALGGRLSGDDQPECHRSEGHRAGGPRAGAGRGRHDDPRSLVEQRAHLRDRRPG